MMKWGCSVDGKQRKRKLLVGSEEPQREAFEKSKSLLLLHGALTTA
jgi:hypothetical protein